MSEFSESIYLRSDDQQDGIDWLRESGLAGYVFESIDGWVQVLPNWGGIYDYDEAAMRRSP